MGQRYPYYRRWEKNIVVVIRIYGSLAIYLLFCDYQDTELEPREMNIGGYQWIFTKKKPTSST